MMNYTKLSNMLRVTHKWIAIAVAAPLILVIGTGIFLQVRKPVEWIQPGSARGSATFEPAVSPGQVLDAVRGVPRMQVQTWDDLKVLDYRPRKGIIKVRTPEEFETQVDAKTGEVIKSGQRLNDIVMKIHDGSSWGARLWLMLPAAVLTLYLLLSGIYMGVTSARTRWRQWRHGGRPRERQRGAMLHQRSFNLSRFCLKYHFWIALIVMVPWLFVVGSGIVLQLRHEIPGVYPEMERGSSSTPVLEYQTVLDIAKTIPELKVKGWSNIWRIYTYPQRGVMQIRTKLGVSAQIDAATGEILKVGARSADFWEDVHEGIFGRHHLQSGSPFGTKTVRLALAVFLPIHVIALFMWITGVVYFVRTVLVPKRRRKRRPEAPESASLAPTA
jgi:uncharacterized iron-regulated membrane protein